MNAIQINMINTTPAHLVFWLNIIENRCCDMWQSQLSLPSSSSASGIDDDSISTHHLQQYQNDWCYAQRRIIRISSEGCIFYKHSTNSKKLCHEGVLIWVNLIDSRLRLGPVQTAVVLKALLYSLYWVMWIDIKQIILPKKCPFLFA